MINDKCVLPSPLQEMIHVAFGNLVGITRAVRQHFLPDRQLLEVCMLDCSSLFPVLHSPSFNTVCATSLIPSPQTTIIIGYSTSSASYTVNNESCDWRNGNEPSGTYCTAM